MNFDKRALLLYAVTDRAWLNGESLAAQVERALRGGATMIQLREKTLDERDFVAEARQLKTLCAAFGVPFLINDNVALAVAVDADGVHVGQSDMEAVNARQAIGPGKILGVSASTPPQARLAARQGADYLGVGAVFPTGTKTDADAVSLAVLREICSAAAIPAVAIGGITAENMGRLAGSGICGVSVISAIFGQPDIEQAARTLKSRAAALFGEVEG